MDTRGLSPTAVRRDLGLKLRGLRTQAGLTIAEVAEEIGFSTSKITKVEKAQLAAGRGDVLNMLRLYGVDDPEQREHLLAMVRDGKRKDWWESYDDLPARFGEYLGLETTASTLHAYNTHLVHGLLQTPDYARALLHAVCPEKFPDEIEQQVEIRMRRQEFLTTREPQPLTLCALMDEAVLRRPIGGRETMRAQIQHLISQNERPNVDVLVLPDELGAHAGLIGPFMILQFDAGERPVIFVESQAGNLYLENKDNLRRCQQTLTHLLAIAPDAEASAATMDRIAKEMT